MNIGRTIADLFYWRSAHLRLIVKNDEVHALLDIFSTTFIIFTAVLPSLTLAPITAVLLSSLAIFSVVAFPILINYTIAAAKIAFNRDNGELLKELRKDGIKLSRILDLFSCSNATSVKYEVLKVIAESDLYVSEIQFLIKTKEQVDAINNIDPDGLKTLKCILSSNALSDTDYRSGYLDSRKVKVTLLDTPEKINMIKSIDHYKLEVILNSDKFYKHDIKNLLKDQQVVNGINSINTEKLKFIVKSNRSYDSIKDLLKDEQAVNGVNSISIEKLTLLFNSNNNTSHFDTSPYLHKSGFLKHITVDQFNLILQNVSIFRSHFIPKETSEDIKYMDERKFLILVKSRLMRTFGDGEQINISLLNCLHIRELICAINSLESAEELQTLVDNFRNDPDGCNNFYLNICQHYINNLAQNQSRLDSLDKNIKVMLHKRPEVSKYFVDNTSAAQFIKIFDNIKSNIVLANKIFYCELLSDDDVINLYKNFDAKKIKRNFDFVLTLYKAGKINSISLDYLFDSEAIYSDIVDYLDSLYDFDEGDEVIPDLMINALNETFFDHDQQRNGQNSIPRLQSLCIEKLITEPRNHAVQLMQGGASK